MILYSEGAPKGHKEHGFIVDCEIMILGNMRGNRFLFVGKSNHKPS